MQLVERIVMVAILLAFVAGGVWLYFAVQYQHKQTVEAVARGEFEIPIATTTVAADTTSESTSDWRVLYPDTVPMTIAGVPVLASVADSLPERILGLSNTPYLPENVVKLFAFGVNGTHSIWMKDMNYGLDILWVSERGEIVHIKENIAPESFPESYGSPVPAWYVIEANAGFVATHGIQLGGQVEVTIAN